MQIQNIKKTNPQHFINKAIKDEVLNRPDTIKNDDRNRGNMIKPYIPVSICDNLIYQTVYLQIGIETLAEDTILNPVSFKNTMESDKIKIENIKQFWENNQDEFLNTIIDYYSYGFGGAEITFDNSGEPVGLFEIQADTLYISKEKNNITGEILYYAVQQVNGVPNTKLRLLNQLDTYPESDDSLGVCLWIGGGRKSSFYDYPCWISCFNHVSASVSLDMLDADKLANGNLISGILTIIRPPMSMNDESIEDTLEEKMEEKGNGLFTLELNTLNPDIPLTVDYVQISESNYDYLKQLADKSDAKILACLKIPKARLLIDDVTESMNSNKTNTLYKIYSKELQKRQRPIENMINVFNTIYFDLNGVKCDIDTPVFVDDKEIETNINNTLFDKGLITYGQAIKKILNLFPEYEEYLEIPLDFNNPIYNERYYNGQPIGFTDIDNPVAEMGDLIDYAKITDILQQQSKN